ncbi:MULTISPECIES: orotidine-5'-phosphate decarboxylase [Corynebacterium]|uniref:orotidine-5'-phosphate decarboxylase n=1 Tax=Corynebacterium TaxID=1716 RepID=UPI001CE3D8EF|nr:MULTISPECIES: orotidine-5'-phosphate decarboxylase [Corynebacterium]
MSNQATAAAPTFGQRFLERAERFGPLCVGMDPHAGILEQWSLPNTVEGLRAFSEICVEAFSDRACVVKPQVAFYEAFGSAGFAVLEESIRALREAGVLVIADAKRGDIGTTMAGYAAAWLRPGSPLEVDAVTVSPYLGFDSLHPVFELAEEHGKGAIVLAATSNPEAPSLQAGVVEGIRGERVSVAQDIVDRASDINRHHERAGNIGVVIGATLTEAPDLSQVNGMILMPGVGAQGGTVQDVKRLTGTSYPLVSPNVSRSVLRTGPDIADLRVAIDTQSAELLK